MECRADQSKYTLVIEKLVIVEYFEGAGGEFIASFINAHWGQSISLDLQRQPDHHQKWLSTNSLFTPDWDSNFEQYAKEFLARCASSKLRYIAAPYHLYKWPHHVAILQTLCPDVKFVRIDSTGHEKRLAIDFTRKVLDRVLTKDDFGEIQLFLKNQPDHHRRSCMELLRLKKLTLSKISPVFRSTNYQHQSPVTNEVVIDYGEFFLYYNKTKAAYWQLCKKLKIQPDQNLLDVLIERNTENLRQQDLFLQQNS